MMYLQWKGPQTNTGPFSSYWYKESILTPFGRKINLSNKFNLDPSFQKTFFQSLGKIILPTVTNTFWQQL
ncbi:hypothetical protein TNCV_3104131 [Trichonephila clavipes]|nr:hypothetical protein TNCV_3104131 [Trichonephila clavipes]